MREHKINKIIIFALFVRTVQNTLILFKYLFILCLSLHKYILDHSLHIHIAINYLLGLHYVYGWICIFRKTLHYAVVTHIKPYMYDIFCTRCLVADFFLITYTNKSKGHFD